MANSLYRQQMSSLYNMALTAEKKYRQYLIDTFALTTKYKPGEIKTLQQCLSLILAPDRVDDKYKKQLQQFNNQLQQQALDSVSRQIFNVLTGQRLNRTLDLLGKEISEHGRLVNKKKTIAKLEDVDIGLIVGNIKEHYFKVAAERQVQEATKDNLFKAVLKDIDNNKMDFLIQDASTGSTKYSEGNKYNFKYITNGVPLEYKASLNPMHLTTKTITNKTILNQVEQTMRHHMISGIKFDKMVEDLELDICRMVVIDKIQQGFPIFVTTTAGTSGKKYILCSEMLKDLSTIQGLKTTMLEQPKTITGFEDLRNNKITLDDVRRVIKEDADLRAQIENELHNLEMRAGVEGMTAEMYKEQDKLHKNAAASSVLKKLIGKTVKTNLWYGKTKIGGK